MARAGAPAPAERDADLTARLREAMIDVVCERGYRSATVASVCSRAGVGVGDFERVLGSREDAFVQIYREETEMFLAVAAAACEAEDGWRDGLRAGAYAGARHLRDHPREARFCILEVLSAGEAAQLQRENMMRAPIAFLDRGRRQLDSDRYVSPAFAAAIVGAISEMLVRRLAEGGDLSDLVDLVPELMYIAVRPYVDGDEALKELTHPAVPERRPANRQGALRNRR